MCGVPCQDPCQTANTTLTPVCVNERPAHSVSTAHGNDTAQKEAVQAFIRRPGGVPVSLRENHGLSAFEAGQDFICRVRELQSVEWGPLRVRSYRPLLVTLPRLDLNPGLTREGSRSFLHEPVRISFQS